MVSAMRLGGLFLLALLVQTSLQADDYYTEPQVYGMRPNPNNEWKMGPIGATGIQAHIYKGMRVTVESIDLGSPAEGKFNKGDVLLGVNGVAHKGLHPLVVFGTALTEAEAKDGTLVFDVIAAKDGDKKQVTLTIPVLGAYSETFPLNGEKSKKIIGRAADFYARKDRLKRHSMWSALACLFLLSTGDDTYVPRVKEYFAQFLKEDGTTTGLEDNSWHNGYNGVACAEYYLRTGDRSVLPILQHYCDDAMKRQKYGVGWGHWGYTVFPSYESGGGMQHSAGSQMLMTLVMGKLCGVTVDDKTLNGALKHWYRYVGHGSMPVADQRYWCFFRDAGRAGATAAVMHIASKAKGDTTIYKQAREYAAMAALTDWPSRDFDFEVYWHSLAGQFVRDYNPTMYFKTMQRHQWSYDLGRYASGGFGWAQHSGTEDPTEAGICLALAYTAPRKTLQITGAPRSKFAKDFTLPEHLWGTEADLAFLSAKHHEDYYTYGKEDEIDVPYWKLPLRSYSPKDVEKLELNMMLKNVRHAHCVVRMAAAKALCMNKHFGEIEKLLRSPDPRLRRAALDGINDCSPWFTEGPIGRYPLKADDYTPAMIKSINEILKNPRESWFVIDGALQALSHAPVEMITTNMPAIMRWSKNEDWWLRESAFLSLSGLHHDEALFVKHLPKMLDIMVKEYYYNPRFKMVQFFNEKLATLKQDSPARKLIVDGFSLAALKSEIRPKTGDYNSPEEGIFNIIDVALLSLKNESDPATILSVARVLAEHAKTMDAGPLLSLVHAPIPMYLHPPKHDGHGPDPSKIIGLYDFLAKLPPEERKILERLLYTEFRTALVSRLRKEKAGDQRLVGPLSESIVELTKLAKAAGTEAGIDAPTPNPATFTSLTATSSLPEVVMTATTGKSSVGPVEYFFDETSGNPGGADSIWTTNAVYRDVGLQPGTRYTYTVKMRDSLTQTGTASAPVSVTTPLVETKLVTVPNGGFETIYKPGQTTITATVSGWADGVGPACPTSGKYEFSDKTTGTVADVTGWIGYDKDGWLKYGATGLRDKANVNLQGLVSGVGRNSRNAYKANGGGWGNCSGGLIVSDAPLGNVQKNATYVLVAYAQGMATPVVLNLLADGEVVKPTSSVHPVSDNAWQKFSRTYVARDLTKHVGKTITIVCGLGRDAKGTQISIDDVSLRYYVHASAAPEAPKKTIAPQEQCD